MVLQRVASYRHDANNGPNNKILGKCFGILGGKASRGDERSENKISLAVFFATQITLVLGSDTRTDLPSTKITASFMLRQRIAKVGDR